MSVVSSPGTRLTNFMEEENVPGFPIAMEREISPVLDLLSLFNLIQLFKKEKPAVVHGNTPKGGLLSMIAAYFTRVPVRVYYLHGLRYEGANGLKRKLLMSMEKISCGCATHVYAVSKGVKATLQRDQICSKPIEVIWNGSINGINTDYFDPEAIDNKMEMQKYGFKEEDLVFGFVGRLSGDKGINELVAAFSKLEKKYVNSKLLLVGMFEEQLDPLLPVTIASIQNNERIIHAGFQSDIRPFLKIMDVFVFPSYREGFGVSIMEAQAMGVPVISSDITGCNEIIITGHNGLLIPSKSENSLYAALEKMTLNPALRQDLSKAARPYMKKQYDQQTMWNHTLTSYKKLLPYV